MIYINDENKIYGNYKMAKLSKNQLIRNDALKDLEQIKTKLDGRTYYAYKNKINNKRIDVVKRLTKDLLIIKAQKPPKKLVIKGVKNLVSKEAILSKSIIRTKQFKALHTKVAHNYLDIITEVDKYLKEKKPVRITLSENGNSIQSVIYTKSVHDNIYFDWFYPEDESILNKNPNAKLTITPHTLIKPEKIAQYFKQGITNCVLKPMFDFVNNKIENSLTQGTKAKYITRLNHLNKFEKEFVDGVGEDEFTRIANTLQFDINVELPFQEKFIEVKSQKKCVKKFNLLNTRLNHIDLNEVVNKEPTYVSYNFIQDIYNKLVNDFNTLPEEEKPYFTFTPNRAGISSISTLEKTYKVINEDYEKIAQWEYKNGLDLCNLDDFKDKELSKFVRQGVHFNCCVDFIKNPHNISCDDFIKQPHNTNSDDFISKGNVLSDDEIEFDDFKDNDVSIDYREYKQMDMFKAYTKFKLCNYYKGFVGKLTCFRKCNKIVALGYYRITNIVMVGWLKEYNDKMNIYNDNVFPSPELEFLENNGCTFDILEGCWGSKIDIDFDDDFWYEKTDRTYPPAKYDNKWYDFAYRLKNVSGIKNYCKYVGNMNTFDDKKCFSMKGSAKYLQNMITVLGCDDYFYANDDPEQIKINYKKEYNKHKSHICGFITSYMRLNMLEQLKTMKVKDIIRICTDGIFYYGDYKFDENLFRLKDEKIKSNIAGNSYISNEHQGKFTLTENVFREHYMTEKHDGAGGSGKTYDILTDNGFNKVCYIAHSWKLARTMKAEYNANVNVWSNLLADDPTKTRFFKQNYNVLAFDEISMYSEECKNIIFKKYGDMCKIIFMGDIGYQADGFSIDKTKPFIRMNNNGFDNIVEHKENYRVKCPKLLRLLTFIRGILKDYNPEHVRKYALDNFQIWEKTTTKWVNGWGAFGEGGYKTMDNDFDYNVKDMILCRTNEHKDEWTEKFKHLEKYYITKNDRMYCNGEIYYEKPDTEHYNIRHAFTVHSIQGESTDNKLFIDMRKLYDGQILYTALSRAKYYKQIYLII